MSDDTAEGGVPIQSSLEGVQKAAATAEASDQLDDRQLGLTVGNGLSPPYPPGRLAALQELNGTHAVAVEKRSKREVGFGFRLSPHPRADEPSDDEKERVENFWRGRDSTWMLGPKGTPGATPVEVLEKGRQDYHGIGWAALEITYNGFADEPGGLSYLPAKTVRVKKKIEDGSFIDEQVAGHGYVQKRDGRTRYFAEAGARHAEDVDGNPDLTYVDRETGETYDSREAMRNAGAKPANELLFIPNPHPNTLYYGIPTWVSEIQTMVADQEARRYNRKRLENDMMLDYVVIVEGGTLSESSREDVREHINGLRESDDPGAWILEADDLVESGIDVESDVTIRVEPMSQPGNTDMDWETFRDANEEDIAQAHSTPLQVLGKHDATNSNSEAAIREYTQEVIEPEQERFAERLYRIIHQQILGVDDYTIGFVTKGADSVKRDAEVLRSVMRAGGGALELNEVRELINEVVDRDIDSIDELDGELFSVVSDPILADELAAAVEEA